jgi:hypothetical protein
MPDLDGIRPQDADTAEWRFVQLAGHDLRTQGRTLEDLSEDERADYEREQTAYVRACTGMERKPENAQDAAESAELRRTLSHSEGRRRYHKAIADLHRSIRARRSAAHLEGNMIAPSLAHIAPRSRERSDRPAARRASSSARSDSGDDCPSASDDADLAWLRGLARILNELDREAIEHDLSASMVPGALCIVLGREEVLA